MKFFPNILNVIPANIPKNVVSIVLFKNFPKLGYFKNCLLKKFRITSLITNNVNITNIDVLNGWSYSPILIFFLKYNNKHY